MFMSSRANGTERSSSKPVEEEEKEEEEEEATVCSVWSNPHRALG